MDRASFAQKCRRDVKTVRSKTNDANRERQRQTRQAVLLARRPIEETKEELKETEEQPELSEKEEQKAAKMSVFMQRYQEFKKVKEKRAQEEKTSKKEVFKVHAVKHANLAPLKTNLGENVSTISKTVQAFGARRPAPSRSIPAPSTMATRTVPPPSRVSRPAVGRSQPASAAKKAGSSTIVSMPLPPSTSSRIASTSASSKATTVAPSTSSRPSNSTAAKPTTARSSSVSSSGKVPSQSSLKPPIQKKKSRIPSPLPRQSESAPSSSSPSSSTSPSSSSSGFTTKIEQPCVPEAAVHISPGQNVPGSHASKDANFIIDVVNGSDTDGISLPNNDPAPTPSTAKVNSVVDNLVQPDFLTRYRQYREKTRSRREASRSSANLSSVSSSSSMMEEKEAETKSQIAQSPKEAKLQEVEVEEVDESGEHEAIKEVNDGTPEAGKNEQWMNNDLEGVYVEMAETGKFLEAVEVVMEDEDIGTDHVEAAQVIVEANGALSVESELSPKSAPLPAKPELPLETAAPIESSASPSAESALLCVESSPMDSAPPSAELAPVSAELAPVSAELAPVSAELPLVSAELPPVSTESTPPPVESIPLSADSTPSSESASEVTDSDIFSARDFLAKVEVEKERLFALCAEAEKDLNCEGIPDAICGRIRTAIGKAQLLANKKFKQFQGLCHECMEPKPDSKRTLASDLLGFWEMVQIQVEDVITSFSKIDTLRARQWTGPATPEPLFKRMKQAESKKTTKPEAAKDKVKGRSNFRQFMASQAKKKEEEGAKVSQAKNEEPEKAQEGETVVTSKETPVESMEEMQSVAKAEDKAMLDRDPSVTNESTMDSRLPVGSLPKAGIKVAVSAPERESVDESRNEQSEIPNPDAVGSFQPVSSGVPASLPQQVTSGFLGSQSEKIAGEEEENSPLATPLEGEVFSFTARQMVDDAVLDELKEVADEENMEVESQLISTDKSASDDHVQESPMVPREHVDRALEFISAMDSEIERITKLSLEAEKDLQHETIPDEIVGKIRAAIGKANLLVTKKMKQFRGLCEDCMSPPPGELITKPDDLLGFWEMVQIQVEDSDAAFSRIDTLRQSQWTGPGTPEPLHKRMKSQLNLNNDAGGKTLKPSKPKGKSKSGLAQFLAQKRKAMVKIENQDEEEEKTKNENDGQVIEGSKHRVGEDHENSPLCVEIKVGNGDEVGEKAMNVDAPADCLGPEKVDNPATSDPTSESVADSHVHSHGGEDVDARTETSVKASLTEHSTKSRVASSDDTEFSKYLGPDVADEVVSDSTDVVMKDDEVLNSEPGDVIAPAGEVVIVSEERIVVTDKDMAMDVEVAGTNNDGEGNLNAAVVPDGDANADGDVVTGREVPVGRTAHVATGGEEISKVGHDSDHGDVALDGGSVNEESKLVPEDVQKANGFIAKLDNEIERISSMCAKVEIYLEKDEVDEENRGGIRAFIGKANLLLTKKFKQFRGLCLKCIYPPEDEPITTPDDLLGFWEMVFMQIEEVDSSFDAIFTLEANNWQRLPEDGENETENSRKGKENAGRKLPPICIGAKTKATAPANDSSKPKKPRMNFRSFLAKKKVEQIKRSKHFNNESLQTVPEFPGNRDSLSPEFGAPRPPPSNSFLPSTPSRPPLSNPNLSSTPSRPPLSPTDVNSTPTKTGNFLAFTPNAKTTANALGSPTSPSLFAFTPAKTTGSPKEGWGSPSILPMHPPVVSSFMFGGDTPELRRLRRSSIFSAQPLRERNQQRRPLFSDDAIEDPEVAEGDLISF